ncbi:MAG: helix-turn-helix domain-containing protein [Anaerolineae bacterium]
MRRYIWRSEKPHSLGLHEYYAQGFLACALNREKIAGALGGVTTVTVSKDINALVKRGVIKTIRTGRGNIFILGKWAIYEEENVYYMSISFSTGFASELIFRSFLA